MKTLRRAALALPALLLSFPAWAQDAKVDAGDTAWMLTSTALVLMMTIPGLALFYAGMVRKKNILATMMQSFFICALVSVVWMVAGYSFAFGNGSAYFGDFSRLFLSGLGDSWDKPFTLGAGSEAAAATTIPESVFLMFQMTFAIITPALLIGAVADRMKFSAMVIFVSVWSLVVYAPICHWVWGGGFLGVAGVLDFAGGTVVHINSGVAGLVAALVLGKRVGYGTEPLPPHNLVLSVIGASLLWVGWFGFNAGSAVAAGAGAGMAMLVTQIAAAAAGLAWMFIEWAFKGKPSVLGIISGAVAGLVAITPAAGFVDPMGALIIGLIAGVGCYIGATSLKHALRYDDSLDAFGIHGIGGIIGAILTGVFAREAFGGKIGLIEGNSGQVLLQLYGVGVTIVYSAVATFIILKVVDMIVGLRVEKDEEREGLDLVLHGEVVN